MSTASRVTQACPLEWTQPRESPTTAEEIIVADRPVIHVRDDPQLHLGDRLQVDPVAAGKGSYALLNMLYGSTEHSVGLCHVVGVQSR